MNVFTAFASYTRLQQVAIVRTMTAHQLAEVACHVGRNTTAGRVVAREIARRVVLR